MRRRSGRIPVSGSRGDVLSVESMRPAVASTRRRSTRPSVVLPDPLSPTMPTVSPRADPDADAVQHLDPRPCASEQAPVAAERRPRHRGRRRRSPLMPRPLPREAARSPRPEPAARPPSAGRSAGRLRAAPAYRGGAARSNMSAVRPSSTTLPPNSTVTSSQICATTPRSCVTKITAVPCARCRLRMSRRICFCTVTSSAVVGSSATMSFGSSAKAAAISTRWRMPPDSSCG